MQGTGMPVPYEEEINIMYGTGMPVPYEEGINIMYGTGMPVPYEEEINIMYGTGMPVPYEEGIMKKITTPLTDKIIGELKAGDQVLISGIIYTARDAAHKRLVESIEKKEKLPVDLTGQIIYYVGPTPARPGAVIGSAGPTTSYRMDKYTPALLDLGLKGMIGKGARAENIKKSMLDHKAVYFAAVGGAAALISKSIKSAEIIAYEDLGTEAIRCLEVEDLPVIVINDIYGQDLYLRI